MLHLCARELEWNYDYRLFFKVKVTHLKNKAVYLRCTTFLKIKLSLFSLA